MKRVVVASMIIGLFASCKKETPVVKDEENKKVEVPVLQECYIGISNKDTIRMTLKLKENKIAEGKLDYNLFEKDKNQGALSGEIKGDTLFADYVFKSEGVSSIREVAFLKKGESYIEGFAEVTDSKGKTTFKDKNKLKFDSKIVLTKMDCK